MKVSVIITTYNRPELLKRAIKSVLNQNFKDWELLVVDDCGDAKNRNVVREFMKGPEGSKIRYIRLKKNFGQHTRPKNVGTAYANADLIAYLDDDNTWRINHLSSLLETMESTGAELVYADRMILDPDGKQKGLGVCIEQLTEGHEKNFNLQLMLGRNYIDTNDVLVKKSILKEIGGWDDNCKRFADWNLFLRIGKLGKRIVRVPEILTDYYLYPDSNQLRHQGFVFDTVGCPTYINGTEPKKIAVFTLTKDRDDYTKRMLESMHRFTKIKFDHFIVDQGSKNDIAETTKGYPIKKIIKNKKNTGISKGSNQALEEIFKTDKYDYILKVDNDCEFITPNWLEEMLEYMNMIPTSFVGPYVEGLVNNPGGAMRIQYGTVGRFLFGPSYHVGGICNIAPSKLYEGFRWNENDRLHDEQDLVLSKYAMSQNYQLGYLEEIKVYHMDSTAGQEEKYPEYFQKRKQEKIDRFIKECDIIS